MSNKSLFADFESMSKAQWLDMVARDPRSANLVDKLDWHAGEILIPAYTTAEDIVNGHPADSKNEIQWIYPEAWKIAQAFDHPATTSPVAFDQAHDAGTEAIWVESSQALAHFSPGSLPLDSVHFFGQGFSGARGMEFLQALPVLPASLSLSMDKAQDLSAGMLDTIATSSPCRTLAIKLAGESKAGTQGLTNMLTTFHRYATRFLAHGLSLSTFLHTIQILVPVGPSFYLEIGRMRAIRLLLSKLILTLDPDFQGIVDIPIIADTEGGYPQALKEPGGDTFTNILRGTTMAMSAILSGCSLLLIRPYTDQQEDQQHADRLARNTQLILKHESHLQRVYDPGAGSYYIETITQRMADAAWEQFSPHLNRVA